MFGSRKQSSFKSEAKGRYDKHFLLYNEPTNPLVKKYSNVSSYYFTTRITGAVHCVTLLHTIQFLKFSKMDTPKTSLPYNEVTEP